MQHRLIAEVQVAPTMPPVCHHAVQFYEKDSSLIEALGQHIGAALKSGDTAIVVATKEHRKALAEELRLRKINITAAINAGHFIQLDAAATLARFMVDGGPDKERFENTIGALVGRARASLKTGGRLAVFGEMVAILWADGHREATVRLEELWNDLAARHSFDLLCGYPLSAFNRLEHRQFFFSICGEHTQVNPAENYPAQGSEQQRRRSVGSLQQESQALRNEIRISQKRIQLLQTVTNAGTWELDVINDTFSFSSVAAKLLGFEYSSRVPLSRLMDLMYYSGDRENVFAQLQAAQRHRKDFATSFRVRREQETRILSMRGKTFYNNGAPIMLGVLSDATPATNATGHRDSPGIESDPPSR